MNEYFWNGFEKQAGDGAIAAAGILAGLGLMGGIGALSGHASDVGNKLETARRGENYKPKSFIQNNPKTTGALSLGLLPGLSALAHKKELDRKNEKVRKVMEEHPVVGTALHQMGY